MPRFTRKLCTAVPLRTDVVSTANGDELAIAEHGDNFLSTKSPGCFQQLFGKMMTVVTYG